ncbi:DNA-binding protein WhiA [Clostridium subterminale]|uniref:Probable cell division protein WhiA n=1 Tax=Clostridium subterminale TaxID=1550 RepID=A0ABN1KQ71_CLOSU
MSFSLKVKNEVCRNSELSKDEIAAQLSAIMKSSGTLGFGFNRTITFKVVTENPAIARWIFKNLKDFFDIHTKLLVKKSNSLKKNNIYMVLIPEEVNVKGLLQELGIIEKDGLFNIHYGVPDEVIKNEDCKRAYIKGAFLGGGSISNPEKTYHLEFVTHDQDYANELSDLINSYKLNSKVIQRKNSFVIYLKEGEQIVDLLNIIGAHNALLELENIRIMKEMRNNVNRIVNCETANLSKTVNAAVRQVESIKLIQSEIGLDRLPKNLKEVAKLRLDFPDESLKELGAMLNPPVGKSGVNHRLRRIEKIADELRKEGR